MDNNAFQEIGEHQKALDEMAQYVNSGEVKGIMFQLMRLVERKAVSPRLM